MKNIIMGFTGASLETLENKDILEVAV